LARKILLADDSVTAQNMGRKILADAGYEVITVNNGSAALKKIGEQRPDLIVLDVYMPGYSGLEVCQRLKDVGDTAQIPILLTVGKLEPFKPEEAKRARADGFIVKPFEASELLSALSKLEDKVVPRSESSKSGRSGRSHAFEESRYDKTMSVEEDTGWKNRIAFPSKKKEKEVREESLDAAADSRPAERGLRDSAEPKAAAAPRNEKSEEQRFDLGALAAAGLPKDVTPEEIAALAAAAARVKERLAQEEKAAQSAPEMAVVSPAVIPDEVHDQAPVIQPEVQAAPSTEVAASSVPDPEKKAPEAAGAETKIESSVPAGANVAAAVAEAEPEPLTAETLASGNGAGLRPSEVHADEPVTMAVGTSADSAVASRWTAVAVALAPEESAISLEHEMQKAYAAFAAAESGHSASTTFVPAGAPSNAPMVASSAPEPTSGVPTTIAPEAVQDLSAVASAAQDAVRAAVEELQSVAASYLKPKATESEAPVTAAPAVEPVAEVKQVAEPAPSAIAETTVDPEAAQVAVAPVTPDIEESKIEKSKSVAAVVPVPVASADEAPEATLSSGAPEVKAEVSKESDLAATTAAAWADWQRIRETASPSDSVASPRDVAAMAAAVGAERRPEDASSGSGSDPAIASIVDSVLNDLRPKIVEEISRKLGKRK
jgi:CheY-like chemotaxis protein